jgi:hypothetical protein
MGQAAPRCEAPLPARGRPDRFFVSCCGASRIFAPRTAQRAARREPCPPGCCCAKIGTVPQLGASRVFQARLNGDVERSARPVNGWLPTRASPANRHALAELLGKRHDEVRRLGNLAGLRLSSPHPPAPLPEAARGETGFFWSPIPLARGGARRFCRRSLRRT